MPISLVEGNSLLAIDVGPSTTRAVLFDVVEGVYRFLAAGQARSTAEAPYKDIGLGIREAIERVQNITGRVLLDPQRRLIVPTQADGSGVDAVVATVSAGSALRIAIVGLLAEVSLESARRLAESTYGQIVERLSLNDRRHPDEQIDALLRARPDLIIVTGGTDGGASHAIQQMLDIVGLACYLMPNERRPAILFAGNSSLAENVQELLAPLSSALRISPNVRPSLDTEDVSPAMHELAHLVNLIRRKQLNGMEELAGWTKGHLLPTAHAAGRIVRFLSRLTGASSGVLNVGLGASSAHVLAGFDGDLCLRVYPQYGLGENLATILHQIPLDHFMRWLSLDISESSMRNAIYQRVLYPSIIPATPEDRSIAQAISRQMLYLAIQAARRDFPENAPVLRPDLMPRLEFLFASGGPLTDGTTPGQNLLLLLDAIQPVGITQVLLDRYNVLPLLGVAASWNAILPVHVLESGAFQNLGTTVSVVSDAHYGTPVLRVRLRYEDGNEARLEIRQGALETLPLTVGQTARLSLQPLRRADVGFGPGQSKTVTVNGGALGVVIDARGRPIPLPADPVRRRELFQKWLWTLGG